MERLAETVLAEMDSYGARVRIVGDTSSVSASADTFPSRGRLEKNVPEWVTVSRDLMAARIREYLDEVGRLPDAGLLERFSAEMGKRLEEFIRDPKGHPWKAVGLAEFERGSG